MARIDFLIRFVALTTALASGWKLYQKNERCFDKNRPLSELQLYADLIVTGTVERLIESPNDHLQHQAVVRVRRLFRSRRHRVELRQAILIENIDDSSVCRSRVRERDTDIFLLQFQNSSWQSLPLFRLNSSVLPITLRNLDAVEAAVKGWPPKMRKPVKAEACEGKLCSFGAICKLNSTDGRPYCECRSSCDSVSAPVCGSDNVTYTNECFLQKAACVTQRKIRVALRSACDTKNPCDSLNCQFGAVCHVSVDGKSAHCVCPEKCHRYGDSRGSRPVCGDDGQNYESECHLRKESCRNNKNISIRYTGLCDPCANVTCPDFTVCKLSQTREPVCRCSEQCSLSHSPVCASDGRTYRNACIMKVQECKSNRELRIVYNTSCEAGANPCQSLRCEHGQECFIDPFGRASCECLHRCEPVVSPVCGKDGVTYENMCELQRISCQKKLRNSVEHRGPCGVGACVNHRCVGYGTVCVIRDGTPTCECPVCTDEFDPVCGSNFITYSNECKLRQQACEMNRNIFLKYRGFCDGCQKKVCDFYGVCVSDNKGQADCQCPDENDCPKKEDPVCATDGNTYQSECHLKAAVCRNRVFSVMAAKGACHSCSQIQCRWGARCEGGNCVCPKQCPQAQEGDQVCGSDGMLYRSECQMQIRACSKAMKIHLVPLDHCSDEFVDVDMTTEPALNNAVTPIKEDRQPSSTVGIVLAVDAQVRCGMKNCSFAGICMDLDADGREECVCEFDFCDQSSSPSGRRRRFDQALDDEDVLRYQPSASVCGSDGRLYESTCHMDKESCKLQKPIYQEDFSLCIVSTTAPASVETTTSGTCECNRIGSKSNRCDSNGQCPCKPGAGGRKCDQCQPGFWGLHLIPKGHAGCQPCGCSTFGSDRDDCEQTTGRCVCKPSVKSSMKCNECEEGKILRPQGCVPVSEMDESTASCAELRCYFGATCKMQGGRPECVCPNHCSMATPAYSGDEVRMEVCGSDGITYGSACQLRQVACRLQSDIVVVALGPCSSAQNGQRKNWKVVKTTRDLITPINRIDSQYFLTTAPATVVLPTESEADNEIGPKSISDSVDHLTTTELNGRSVRLGDFCLIDGDCLSVRESFCAEHLDRRACLCRKGWVPADDQLSCVLASNQIEPCAEERCANGGTCMESDDKTSGGFRCICPRGYTGVKCEKKTEKDYRYVIPSFSGHSWLEFDRMDAYSDVIIEIELKPETLDGLILYNGQKADERGDFISLALIKGHIEFRYNLGDGPITMRSIAPLSVGQWHKIIAHRIGQRGHLIVDNSSPVTTPRNLPGSNTNLNLKTNMFLGKVPHMPKYVVHTVGTRHGFHGCVLSFKINGKIYDLRLGVSVDFDKSHDIGECGVNPCSSLPCLNGGTCSMKDDSDYVCTCDPMFTGTFCEIPADSCASQPCQFGGTCQPVRMSSSDFTCLCHQGRTGIYCENAVEEDTRSVIAPEFRGIGYLELRQTSGEFERTLSIGMWLKPYKPDGLLLFSGSLNDIHGYGGGDFISLALVHGRVQFLYNLGSGTANITSHKPLRMNEWHSIKVYRHLRNGTLQIDDDKVQHGESPPPWDRLNLDTLPIFVGGARSVKLLKAIVGVDEGFYGAIQKVTLNGLPMEDLTKAALFSSGVVRYQGAPCNPNPCQNDGICVGKLDDFSCRCGLNFRGKHCEHQTQADIDTDQPIAFDGHTHLKYLNRITQSMEGQQDSKYVIRLRTNATDGLILWENRGMTLRGDYLAIAVMNGHIVVSFNLGKEQVHQKLLQLRSRTMVSDGKWHIVRLQRSKRQAYLTVDDEETPTTAISSPGATELNTDGFLWLGGNSQMPMGLNRSYYVGFVGCIESVLIGDQRLHLSRHRTSGTDRQLMGC